MLLSILNEVLLTIKHFLSSNRIMLTADFFVFFLEFFVGRKKYLEFSLKDNLDNLKYFIINYMFASRPLDYLLHFIILTNLHLLFKNQIEYISIFKNLGPITSFLICLFLYDFLQFHIHYFNHKYDFLWEFHKTHHAVNRLNVTAHFRGSLVSESLFQMLFAELPLMLLGLSVESIMQTTFIFMIISIFVHADIKYKFPILSKFLVTPHLHLWHHAAEKRTSVQQNIGSLFNIWDRVYKVYYYTDELPLRVGLPKDDPFPKTVFKQMLYPYFKK